MAFIGTLRNKMGTWVVIFVFVAITAFILGDIFSGKSNILNWGRNTVGEIAGKDISYDEYLNTIRERETSFLLNTGREPGEREMPGIRQQAWDLLIARHAIETQYTSVGVEVTEEEVMDMIWGKNIDPGIRQAFTNQETGQFEADRVVSYIRDLKNPPAGANPQVLNMWQEQRTRWELFQKDLKPSRERIKYEMLLLKSTYVTKAEAELQYHLQTDVAEVKYLYVPFYLTPDSAAQVSDSDLETYYNKNKEKFKTEQTRDLKYVSFPVVPSADDTAAVRNDLSRALAEFRNSTEDSTYAVTNSDNTQNAYTKYTLGTLPAFVNQDSLIQGKVFGPVLNGDAYTVVKVSKVFRDTSYTARAKHILIKWEDTSDAAKKIAKEKALAILKDIKGGADFGAKARELGFNDGSPARGGDIGWFSSSDNMAKPFKDAVFAATKPGLLNTVVETEFGYHIIDVTNSKTNQAYTLATVERFVTSSDATTNEAFRKAENFASDLSSVEDFEAKAKTEGVTVLDAKNVLAGDNRIGTLGDARQIVQWLFRDASEGKISQVYDLHDQNVVAVMTKEVKKGYKPLDLVKTDITPLVRNEIKGKLIIQKLNEQKGTLEEIAAAYGQDANVYSSSDLRLNSNSIPSVGFDPQAVGVAFSLENGKRSKPVAGENGVVIIETQNKTVAPAMEDYSMFKTQLEQSGENRGSMNIAEAIKESSDIVDKRYKFF